MNTRMNSRSQSKLSSLKLESLGLCKIWLFFLTFCTLMALTARADESVAIAAPVEIELRAQLWWRPVDLRRNLEFKLIGPPQKVEASVDRANPTAKVDVDVGDDELKATVKFFLVFPRPNTGDEPYVSVQTRIFHPEKGFIAECANFDPIARPRGIGVGVCSGVVGTRQFGVSLSKLR